MQDAISLASVVNEAQPSLWQDKVKLDDGFWKSLKDHPVPVREEAVRAIGARSMAIDVYIWLAYRLHSLTKTMPVSWPAVHAQFGGGFKLIRQMKPVFVEAFNLALAVYPEARVDGEGGLILHPSPPAVPKAEASRLGILTATDFTDATKFLGQRQCLSVAGWQSLPNRPRRDAQYEALLDYHISSLCGR